jgi:hypothetical protein
MKTWTRVPFAVGAPGTGSSGYQAKEVGIVSVVHRAAFTTSSRNSTASLSGSRDPETLIMIHF